MLYVEILQVNDALDVLEDTLTPSWEMHGGAAVFSSSASMRRGMNFSTADIGMSPR